MAGLVAVITVLGLYNSSSTAVAPFIEDMLGVRNCESTFLLFNPSTRIVEPLLCGGTFLSVGNKAMNKRVKVPAVKELIFSLGEADNDKQVNYVLGGAMISASQRNKAGKVGRRGA